LVGTTSKTVEIEKLIGRKRIYLGSSSSVEDSMYYMVPKHPIFYVCSTERERERERRRDRIDFAH
jgi:hypothetical protein